MRPEFAFSNDDPPASESRANRVDEINGLLGCRGVREGWPSSPANVPLKGELTDHQDTAVDIGHRSVHLPGIVREDSQPCNLAHERVGIRDAITHANADKQHQADTYLTDGGIVHEYTSLRHSLDHRSHCISVVDSQTEPTLASMIRSVLLSAVRGFVMGAADIVPGVSGGTIALIFGIYERLIASIRAGSSALGHLLKADFVGFKRWMNHVDWLFILPLGVGILTAVVALAHVLERLLEEQAVVMAALFMGLVAGSIVVAWAMLKVRETRHTWIAVAVSLVIFVSLGLRGGTSEDTVAQISDPQLWAFFLAGALAICAMILPGISGSFILVLLGMYGPLLGAVTDRDFLLLGVFVLGTVVGLALFSQILHKALMLYHDTVMAVLVGLMAGSLRVLWPWPAGVDSTAIGVPDSSVLLASVIAVTAFVTVIVVARFAQRLETADHPTSTTA